MRRLRIGLRGGRHLRARLPRLRLRRHELVRLPVLGVEGGRQPAERFHAAPESFVHVLVGTLREVHLRRTVVDSRTLWTHAEDSERPDDLRMFGGQIEGDRPAGGMPDQMHPAELQRLNELVHEFDLRGRAVLLIRGIAGQAAAEPVRRDHPEPLRQAGDIPREDIGR